MNEEEIKKLLDEMIKKAAGSVTVSFEKASKVAKLSMEEVKKLFKKNGMKFQDGDEDRVIPFMFTDATPDRHNEIVLPEGVDLKEFKKNPIILFAHNSRTFPIGSSIKTEHNKELGGVVGHIFFMDDERDPTGVSETVFRMIKAGTLKTGSIGFGVKPNGVRLATEEEIKKFKLQEFAIIFTEIELREFSIVPVPANPSARRLSVDETIFENRELEFVKEYDFLDNDESKDMREILRAKLVAEAKAKAGGSGVTGEANDHKHPFTVDDKGNGTAKNGTTDNSKHTHDITEFKVQQSDATGKHTHSIPDSVKKKPKKIIDDLAGLKDLFDFKTPDEILEKEEVKKTDVKTLVFSKEKFTEDQAKKWSEDNGFKDFKFDDEDLGIKEGSFKTISLTDGVKAVVDIPKRKDIENKDIPNVQKADDTISISKSVVEELMKAYCKIAEKQLGEDKTNEELTVTEDFMKNVVNMKRGSILTKDEIKKFEIIIKNIENLKSSLEDLIKNTNKSVPDPESNGDLNGTPTDRSKDNDDLYDLLNEGTEKFSKN